jgi:hypothetical protein
MRIHTKLNRDEMSGLLSGLPVYFEVLAEHGSRKAPRAFEVRLSGSGGTTNSGTHGAGNFQGATWDEWGAFFGRLYSRDDGAVCGSSYTSAEHFHWLTGSRFVGGELPKDTHKRHKWEFDGYAVTGAYGVSHCGKCSAVARQLKWGNTWASMTEAAS